MDRSWRMGLVGVVLALAVPSPWAFATPFKKDCGLPYNSPQKKHGIDGQCDRKGTSDPADSPEQAAAHLAQNAAKNNLCANGQIVDVTFDTFNELQADADALVSQGALRYGTRFHLPTDRSKLTGLATAKGPLGEGSVVRLTGIVEVGKRGSVEDCNCGAKKVDDQDIHIHLIEADGEPLCHSIVAEMIPHYRPKAWHWTNVRDLKGITVRVTGQLFFDASHKPCVSGKPGSRDPARSSVWEIHPVYQFEVCGEEECQGSSGWVTLEKWLQGS